eukprot:4134467-Amphidinium_carterae.1
MKVSPLQAKTSKCDAWDPLGTRDRCMEFKNQKKHDVLQQCGTGAGDQPAPSGEGAQHSWVGSHHMRKFANGFVLGHVQCAT